MSDEAVQEQGVQNTDSAAIDAVSAFWQEGDRDEAAAKEVPDSQPASSEQADRMRSLRQNDLDEQQQELEQEGEIDPTAPDGIPVKEAAKPVQSAKGANKPAAEAELEESGLDPVLRSIAEDAGWTQDKIDRLYKADPELATETFEGLANSYAALSRQYLAQTPAQVQQTQAAVVQTQTAQSQAANSGQLPADLTDEALKKFAEENGDANASLMKSIRDHFVSKNSALEQRLQTFEKQVQQAEMQAIGQEASSVISSLAEKFPKLYGSASDPSTLLQTQFQTRQYLGALADQIRAGAIAQGKTPPSVKDALQRAHYIVSHDSLKSETRREIQGQVKKRSASATLKPTQRNNPAAPGQKRGDDAAINAASEKMVEIGMND